MARIGPKWIKMDKMDWVGPMWTKIGPNRTRPMWTKWTEFDWNGLNGLNRTLVDMD